MQRFPANHCLNARLRGRLAVIAAVAGGLLVAASLAWLNYAERDRALAEHAGPTDHGVQVECSPQPSVVTDGQTVTVTYTVRNAAGVPGNDPDHDLTYWLVDTWFGDLIDPSVGGQEPDVDTLQHHLSPNPAAFTEDADQQTYVRQFVFGTGVPLLNSVTLQGTFDDGHSALKVSQCAIALQGSATPTATTTNTPTETPTSTPTHTPPDLATSTPTNTPPPGEGDEGCGPGFWKQAHQFDDWTSPYHPGDQFSEYFENAFPGMTLLQVLQQGGGGLNALGRQTVAALLNAASPDLDYQHNTGQVVSSFNSVFPDTKAQYEGVKDTFEAANNSQCRLN